MAFLHQSNTWRIPYRRLGIEALQRREVLSHWIGPLDADPCPMNSESVECQPQAQPVTAPTDLRATAVQSTGVTSEDMQEVSHVRIWLRPEDVVRLRTWAVDSNPLYAQGLRILAEQAKADMDQGLFEQDEGGTQWEMYPNEMYAQLFAFMSLIGPDEAGRADYAQRARTLLMNVIDEAAKGPAEDQPFRDPSFSTFNRSRWWGTGLGTTVNWIYPHLSAQDKATIREVFLRWTDENINATTTDNNHPEPIGVFNDPALLDDPTAVRWAANNFYLAHMRNIGLMALSFDPADDPGGQLRSKLDHATGAFLYVADHLFRNEARGGFSPEGLEYGPASLGYMAQFLLALKTAGEDNPAAGGPQVDLTGNPFWNDVVPAYLHSLSARQVVYPDADWVGPVYQPAWYGDGQNYWMPDFIGVFGPLGVYDQLTGNEDRLEDIRWIQKHTPPGGDERFLERISGAQGEVENAIFYFMLYDPNAPEATDARPDKPLNHFAQGTGRILARTGWDENAAVFTYMLGWTTIDHQSAEGNQIEFYRNGEWLTKGRVGWDGTTDLGTIARSDYHNTLAIENNPLDNTSDGFSFRFQENGSQFILHPAGEDGAILAHSFGHGYVYAVGDATGLYNVPDNDADDVTHVSRSVIWIEPDHVVTYDRAETQTDGRFKRYWLNLPNTAEVNGNQAVMTTDAGQQLFVTAALPPGAPIAISAAEPFEDVANQEPMQHRLMIEAPGGPERARFLTVLQGADAAAQPDPVTVVESTNGAAFEGVLVDGFLVMFPEDLGTSFATMTYTTSLQAQTHLITGLDPNVGYRVETSTEAGQLQVTIASGGSHLADSGGVLKFSSDASDPNVSALSILDASVQEGDSGSVTAEFQVTLSASSDQTVRVDYSTADGVAASGSDFTASSGTVTFDPGTTFHTISVTVSGDTLKEADETFFVNLSNPSGATIADGQGVGTIVDDDQAVGRVWAHSGDDQVLRDELRASSDPSSVLNRVWDGVDIALFGAGNETVSFNLVLEAPTDAATDVNVSITSLVGPGGQIISARPADGNEIFNYVDRDIELFYVRYLEIKGLSSDLFYDDYDERHIPEKMRRPHNEGEGTGSWSDRPGANKFFPEIAVPLELEGAFNIAAGQNQSIWGDIFIPKDTRPGTYTGTVTITENGAMAWEIPLSLEVYDFDLPDFPNAKTMLYISPENINDRYLGIEDPDPAGPAQATSRQIVDRHFQMAHRHKISLIGDDVEVGQMDRDWAARLSGELFTPQRGYDGVGAGVGNNVFSIATYGGWDQDGFNEADMWAYTDAWANWFDSRSFSTPTDYFMYLIDESDNYAQTEQWARWINDNPGPGGQLMSMATIPLPDAAARTPSLDIAASWFTTGTVEQWEDLAQQYAANADKRFWLYNSNRPGSGSFAIEDDGVAQRELAWGQYKQGIDRWFYWESTYYDNFQGNTGETNVFQTAQTFGNFSGLDDVRGETGFNYTNGDGVLFYPGTDVRYAADSYGVAGPLASLRLKHWRRGIQDVDYLAMAAAVDPERTRAIVDRIIPSVLWENGVTDPDDPTWVLTDISWSTDPDIWEAARAELAEIINASSFGDGDPVVRFSLGVVDADGNPVSSVAVGDEFQLRVSVQDLRDMPQGVFSAYLDVTYDARLATVIGPITFADQYANSREGDTSLAGLVDDAGAHAEQTPLGGGAMLLWSVPLRAVAEGQMTFTADPADLLSLHDVLLYGSNEPIEVSAIDYGAVTVGLTVANADPVATADEFTIFNEPSAVVLDVLANDSTEPGETLSIDNVSQASQGGTVAISTSGQILYTPAAGFFGDDTFTYTIRDGNGGGSLATALVHVHKQWHNAANPVDTNGDHFVTPLDALIGINYLNTVGALQLPSVPTDGDWSSFFLDVTNDGFMAPIDVLAVINELNRRAGQRAVNPAAEGEWPAAGSIGCGGIRCGPAVGEPAARKENREPAAASAFAGDVDLALMLEPRLGGPESRPATRTAERWPVSLLDEVLEDAISEFAPDVAARQVLIRS